MNLYLSSYRSLLFLSALVAFVLSFLLIRRAETVSIRTFAKLMLAVGFWSLVNAFETLAGDYPVKIFLSKILYLSVVSVPGLWLAFMLEYTSQTHWLTRFNRFVIWIVPFITMLLAATNEWHGLIWSSIYRASSAPNAQLVYVHGYWFWLWMIYSYCMLALGVVTIIFAMVQFPRIYRVQVFSLLVGSSVPFLINGWYVFGFSKGVDPTPIGFAISGLVISITLIRFHLFQLVPVARSMLFDHMNDGVLVLDAKDHIVDINKMGLQYLNITEKEALGQHADDALKSISALGQMFKNVEEAHQEVELQNATGAPVYFDLRITPIRNFDGMLIGRTAVFHETTDRRLAENALRDSEVLYHSLVQNMQVAVFMKDIKGVYTYVNRLCCEMKGLAAEEILGKTDFDIYSREEAQFIKDTDAQVIHENATYSADEEMNLPNGKKTQIRIIKFPVYDKHEKITGVQGVFWDVSDIKRNEEALRLQAEQLSTLNRSMQALSSTLNLRDVLDKILSELRRVVPYDSSSVLELKDNSLEIVGGHGFPNLDELLGISFRVDDENSPSTVVMRKRTPFILEDAPAKYPAFNEGKHAAARIHGWMGVPMLFGSQVIGMISLDKHDVNFYTRRHAELALVFASQAAIAIQNARLFARERAQVLRQSALFGLSHSLAAMLEEEEIWQGLVEGLYNEELGYIHIIALEWNKDTGRKIMRGGIGWNQSQKHTIVPQGKGLSEYPLRDGQPHYSPDVTKDAMYVPGLPEGCEADIPIKVGEEIAGVLSIQSAKINGFSQDDLDVFIAAADQANLALGKARLLQETQQRLAEIALLQDQLREQAIRDPLTGLYNRRYLDESLEREFMRASRDRYPVSIVIMDLDHFKRVNDTFGHKVGDRLLQRLGNFLRTQSRSSDITCRYGGEEFIVVLPNTSIETAAHRAEQWRIAFQDLYVDEHGQHVQATLSLGIAAYPINGEQSEEILIKADTALYHAKQTGRNKIMLYDKSIPNISDLMNTQEQLKK